MFNSLWPHGLQHTRLSFPSLSPRVSAELCPLSQWCHPTASFSDVHFCSCPQSFPASGSFPVSWHFTSGGPSFGASAPASVLPMNIQDWCPLGCTGLISLLSEGSSGVFSSTAGWKHWFRELEQCSWSRSIPVRETRRQPGFLLSRWVDFYQATFPQTGLVLQTGV